MYYSLTFSEPDSNSSQFKDKNTWNDWYLAPTNRPSFSPPEFSMATLEIPGKDGLIDLTTALRKYPTYSNRTGSLEFLIHPESPYTWHETYSKLGNYLHGQRKRVSLEDNPAYWYEGRFWLDSFETGDHYSTISIQYNLQPYKKSKWTTTGDWEWDPFNFKDGVILSNYYKNLQIDSSDEFIQIFNSWNIEEDKRQEAIGRMTVCPTFIINSTDGKGIDIWAENDELSLSWYIVHMDDGSHVDPNIIFSMQHPENGVRVAAKGHGTVSIDFYIGSL